MNVTPKSHILVIHTEQQRYDTLGMHGCLLIGAPTLNRLGIEDFPPTRG